MLFDVVALLTASLTAIQGKGLDDFRLIEVVDVALGTRRGVVA